MAQGDWDWSATTEAASSFFFTALLLPLPLPLLLLLLLPPQPGFPIWAAFMLRRSHNREEKMRHLASPRCFLRKATT